MTRLVCPDCGADMRLVRNSKRKFWGCSRYPNCLCVHGAHQKTGEPLGRPADAVTRTARVRAHQVFDRLWKEGGLTREQAYIWMRRELKLKQSEAHISKFTLRDCEKLMEALKRARKAGMFKPKKETV